MLNPSEAVETTTPGACGCQCTSLMSCWPWWQKRSCAGTSLRRSASSPVGRSSSSSSTERSHSVTWSSAPAAAKHDSSVGCHSIDVMGPVCQLNAATGVGAGALVLQEVGERGSSQSHAPFVDRRADARRRERERERMRTHPLKLRKSHTLMPPSSPPDARR